MYEQASAELVEKLTSFTGCRVKDLQQCRGYLRLLSRDLPTFDSLWLDALVQARKLTVFQADRIASGQAASLQVGPFQLVNLLSQDGPHRRYVGRDCQTGSPVLIDEHAHHVRIEETVLQTLQGVRSRIERGAAESSLVAPLDVVARHDRLYVVSPYREGNTVRELLIRRGRFPEDLARVITRQMVDALRILERTELVHGDLRASNVLLNRRGQMFVLNTGVRPALTPWWTVQTELPFEAYDTFAPETIRSGQWQTSGDAYSAGCLLWQIACGRPPLHSADRLLKLKAHLTRSIPNVQEYAPDIDDPTATTIFQLTRTPVESRGLSARLPVEMKSGHDSAARRVIGQFVREFEFPQTPVPHTRPSGRTAPTLALVTAACVVCGCLGLLYRVNAAGSPGAGLDWVLSIGRTSQNAVVPAVPEQTTNFGEEQELGDLPGIDDQGRLVLQAGQTYRASDVSTIGPLTIISGDLNESGAREPNSPNAEILVSGQPWRIWATEVQMFGVTVRYRPEVTAAREDAGTPPPALLVCQSLNLQLDRCLFEMPTDFEPLPPRAIAWKPLESGDVNSGQLLARNCEFLDSGHSLLIGGAARRLRLQNCLKVGRGDLLELSDQFAARGIPELELQHVTLRDADSLVHLHLVREPASAGTGLNLTGENCVFHLQPAATGLITLSTAVDPAEMIQEIRMSGQILLVGPETRLLAWRNPSTGEVRETSTLPPVMEGLMSYPITFAGAAEKFAAASMLQSYEGPRWNSAAPGIQPELLSRFAVSAGLGNSVARPDVAGSGDDRATRSSAADSTPVEAQDGGRERIVPSVTQ